MKRNKFFSFLTIGMLLVSIILTGCSKSETSSGENGLQVIKIATQSPLSGGSATPGEAIKLGAELSIKENQKRFNDLGFKLVLVPYDDQGDPKKGVSNAQDLSADKQVLGVIGHYNSGVAIPSSEVYEKNNVAMVAPMNTGTAVTDRGLKVVNRICGRDDQQGPAAAKFMMETLKCKKIFIIQDKTAYGTGLSEEFKKAAEAAGAEILGYEGITIGEKDFNGVLNQVASKKPDGVFFGGLYAEGGLIIKQAREKGIDIPIVGGDGMDSSTLVEIAGSAVKNTYYTSVAGDANTTEDGKKFVENYKKTYNKNVETSAVYGYDSTGAFLEGLEKAINDNGGKLPSREQVRDAVRAVKDFQGALTKVSFDSKGDNENAVIFIYEFKEEKYPPNLIKSISKE